MGILRNRRRESGVVTIAVAEGRPHIHSVKPVNRSVWMRRGAWLFATLFAMAGTTHLLFEPPAFLMPPKPQVAKVQSDWSEIRKPLPLYAFAGGLFDRSPTKHAARRHTDGSRIDILSWGAFDALDHSAKPWMRLQIHRAKAELSEQQGGLFVRLARLAAGENLSVTRSSPPDLLVTRLGDFAVGDVEISGASGKAVCLGYMRVARQPALLVTGIVCGTADTPVDRKLLGCTLNRLTAISARDDRELLDFFAKAQLNRGEECRNGRTAGMRNRADWLELPTPVEAVDALRLTSLQERKVRR